MAVQEENGSVVVEGSPVPAPAADASDEIVA